ncbi:RNA polymerase recycling motor ATPase HelR [Rhodococcus sp. IEGM 1401]|uniref:RNA polymerase recycling motor ATPase HelR n=1 Tax=unclassified Rhodococcus (in: high G+C Gram-positive bacteria) TaxID=192944 RepID=UPI0022B47CA4|nr:MULTISPECIES: RNA polymerase recycling motor ATPase HelR [unclassified Rhodococcus (in: high G+C Gram-positive bacteria)]MCZ4560240.1 RNA polymerase recycling motor ATPase HelR [Rhodococcus sp. IEGM 1401]MDI9920367.1 RNA polymerase recycling motor ATPase HelR [Rhodococcus sp. IEGM 1372]MDV8032947.1 RNA polymerase recycling motor ATPase HelR [Rhodococcus sp. IEGM 1414]
MKHAYPSVFDLPDNLARKRDSALIGQDKQHFSAIRSSIEKSRLDTSARLEAAQKSSGRMGREVMERDFEIHRLGGRLRSLRRYGVDLCLGRVVTTDADEPVYIGRLGLLGTAGKQLLVDWRSPAAEPFFGATHANPMGLRSRRRYRWTNGTITDYWDEVFYLTEPITDAALDDQSAFIASLGTARSPRMRDVLGTVQADQDAIIRADARGALVVDGGPGTGKTVVALHRTAYLLYAETRLGHSRGGVLFIGPHEPYLAYVSDVLPSLGEDGVQTCTLRDLVAEGTNAIDETNPSVAQLKATESMNVAIDAAVAFYEQPPTRTMIVETEWADLTLTAADWAEAFEAPDPGTPHNEAREQVWELLLTILMDRYDGDEDPTDIRKSLQNNESLRAELERSWTIIDAPDLVADLWSVPAYLRSCAPWLAPEDIHALQRPDPTRWTVADLPLLDAARMRLGDPEHARRTRRRELAAVHERARMDRVVDELMAADDDEMMAAQLRQDGIRDALVDSAGFEQIPSDPLAGPFAHIVVDEAQELTDAQWHMVLRRCPSRSITIVGDRAQARLGFAESWRERLGRVGLDRVRIATLGVNYRTPQEVMAEAEPVIRAALPDANVPVSIRSTGVPVEYGDAAQLASILDRWLQSNIDGIACVIGDPTFPPSERIRSLTPQSSKGLEFDLVVLIDPDSFGSGIAGAVDRYVAMTRATGQLVVLTAQREAAPRTPSTA